MKVKINYIVYHKFRCFIYANPPACYVSTSSNNLKTGGKSKKIGKYLNFYFLKIKHFYIIFVCFFCIFSYFSVSRSWSSHVFCNFFMLFFFICYRFFVLFYYLCFVHIFTFHLHIFSSSKDLLTFFTQSDFFFFFLLYLILWVVILMLVSYTFSRYQFECI